MGMCIDDIEGAEPYSVEVRSSHGEFVLRGADPYDYVYSGAPKPEHAIRVLEQQRPSELRDARMADERYADALYMAQQLRYDADTAEPVKRAMRNLFAECQRARDSEDESTYSGVGSVTFSIEDIPKLRAVLDAVEAYVASTK